MVDFNDDVSDILHPPLVLSPVVVTVPTDPGASEHGQNEPLLLEAPWGRTIRVQQRRQRLTRQLRLLLKTVLRVVKGARKMETV